MNLRIVAIFVMLFAFWILLSWQFTALFLVIGAISAAAVTAVSAPLLARELGPPMNLARVPIRFVRFIGYVGWILYSILTAGIQIALDILTPRQPGKPHMLRFTTELATPAARAMLADSISVVPGTITIEVDDDTFLVHAFDRSFADGLVDATVQNRIARLFDLEPEEPPEVEWNPADDPVLGDNR